MIEYLLTEVLEDDASLRARLEAQTMRGAQLAEAVGVATTCVPSMEMDPEHPVEMMQQVCAALENMQQQVADLTAKLEASEKQTTAVKAYLEMVENGQANAETMRELTDKVATLAHVDDAYHEAQRQYAEAQATIAGYQAHDKAMAEAPAQHWEDGLRCLEDERDQLQSTIAAQREEIGRLRAALSGLLTEVNHATCLDSDGRRYNTYKSGIELRNLSRAVKMCEQALDEGKKEAS